MACYERNVAVPDMLDRIHKEGDILIRCVTSAAATSRGEPLETTRRTKYAIKLVDGEERGHTTLVSFMTFPASSFASFAS